MFHGVFTQSLLGKARDRGVVDIRVQDLRLYCEDKHRTADDRPFGGGPGMVLKAEPIYKALQELKAGTPLRGLGKKKKAQRPTVVFMSPQGQALTQSLADELSQRNHLVILAGHYEGIDERLMDWVDLEVSIGDVVLTGGEIPAMALVDCVARKKAGVVKEEASLTWDSFAAGWGGRLDCPHYTRPSEWQGRPVPKVLLSGDHKAVQSWREEMSRKATEKKRPDLLEREKKKMKK